MKKGTVIGMKGKTCFTLIELIVVIAIIAILAAIIAPNAFKAIDKAKVSRACADLKAMKTAVMTYYADVGSWPLAQGVQGIRWTAVYDSELVDDPGSAGWDGPYLEKSKVMHPWSGIYALYSYDLQGNGVPLELSILLSNHCFPTPGVLCSPPAYAMELIDRSIDDGDVSAGEFRTHPLGGSEGFYIYYRGM